MISALDVGRRIAIHNFLILIIKGVAGGSLVVAFSLLSEGLGPKRFAGLFSAAPAVALAGLVIVLLDEGRHEAHLNSLGMIAGAIGMSVYAATTIPLLRRMSARRAVAAALGAWTLTAAAVALPILLA